MPAVREAAVDGTGRTPKLLVAPHAGYEYSGTVAAHAYALIGGQREPIVRRVVLLGPVHRVALDGLAVPDAVAFETPLGEVPLDLAALADLDERVGTYQKHKG